MAAEYRGDRVTLLVCHNRKPGMNVEDFQRYWRAHAAVFMSMDIAKRNLLKYEQLHPNQNEIKDFPATLLPYDGAVIFQAKTYGDIMSIFQSDEYIEKVVPDEERFIDRTNPAMLPCDMVTVVDK